MAHARGLKRLGARTRAVLTKVEIMASSGTCMRLDEPQASGQL
jgi:hypothetical protein